MMTEGEFRGRAKVLELKCLLMLTIATVEETLDRRSATAPLRAEVSTAMEALQAELQTLAGEVFADSTTTAV
jgi:hypothetical protein